ncbi:protein mak16 [Quercus suber]|uniref:Protein mak16 n=1 Tax=Quercus suber TaxID=58331 RepID=A0AAW0JP16_QUESU
MVGKDLDVKGVFYLYMKTIERAHMPNKLWERVKLPRNYEKALEIIDKHLMYWQKTLVHKTKQRLTKMTQMRIRMRKLALKTRLRMQHDEVIWQVIRHNHCSFMSKITTGNFCRNPYNVTGICNRSSCPLANSRYATIRDHDGVFYLYMKTIERAHMPNKLWERVKLPRNYEKALEIIDKHLMYWQKTLVHKTKQRLTKMTQMRIRMRKLALKTREKIMTTPRKEKKREARREEKAEKAAALDKSIEKELLERLQKGVYGDIYNYPVKEYNKVLDIEEGQAASEDEEEMEPEIEYVEGYEDLDIEDDIEDFGGLAIARSQRDNDNVGMDSDDEKVEPVAGKRLRKETASASRKLEKDGHDGKSKKRARVLVEEPVEHGDADEREKVIH